MSQYDQLDSLSYNELIRTFAGNPPFPFETDPEQRDLFYEEVALKIVSRGGAAGVNDLLDRLDHLDPHRLPAALCALSLSKSPLFDPEALFTRFLNHDDPLVLLSAIDGLRHYQVRAARERILPLLRHATPNVVGAALEYLGHLFPEEARPHLLQALRSTDPLLREWAVEIIDDTGAEDLLIDVAPLLKDPDPDVRRAAHWAIAKEQPENFIDPAGANDTVEL